MKALVVDDSPTDRKKFADIARSKGLEVITANGVIEGINVALNERPYVIITDKDMPDGSGNDVAAKVMNAYQPIIVGVTGGNQADFATGYFVARLNKSSIADYEKVLDLIVAQDPRIMPGREYVSDRKIIDDAVNDFAPLDVMIQGYMYGSALLRGEQPIPGVTLKAPNSAQIEELVDDLFTIGIDFQNLSKTYAGLSPSCKGDDSEKVNSFLRKLEQNDKQAFKDSCTVFHAFYEKLAKME